MTTSQVRPMHVHMEFQELSIYDICMYDDQCEQRLYVLRIELDILLGPATQIHMRRASSDS